VPPFRSDEDCTPWVLAGLWPADLEKITPETQALADYLKTDLQRIADSANERLRAIRAAGLTKPAQQAEESRVLNVARAFAVLRVESTVRQLRREPLGFQPELLRITGPRPVVVTDDHAVPVSEPQSVTVVESDPVEPLTVAEPEPVIPEPVTTPARESAPEPEPARARHRKPAPADFGWSYDAGGEPPTPEPARHRAAFVETDEVIAAGPASPPTPPNGFTRPDPASTRIMDAITDDGETDEQRLQRLVRYVARQVPGLRWAVGLREDGAAVLATDLAHGWIPAGIDIPAGVELLSPQRRTGNLAALLGFPDVIATYAPGDNLGRFDTTTTASDSARTLEPIDDLGWKLGEATHWREGLPRIAHTLAKAGAAGTGVVEAELDVLRVHLDTAGYQLTARYPDLDNALLLNCLLLAATADIASGDTIGANYHFSWFSALSAPPATSWSSASP